jgi:hypothetical protein
MTKKTLLLLLLMLFLAPRGRYGQDGPAKLMLAVLEFSNDAKLSAFEAETLADDVRSAALDILGSSFRIMTRESMMAMLPPGTDLAQCSEGQCEVEAGRKVGADRVVAGSVGRFEKDLVVRLKLFDTHSADLLAQKSASGATLKALRDNMRVEARSFFGVLARGTSDTGTRSEPSVGGGGNVRSGVTVDKGEDVVNAITDEKGFLKIETTPQGASILLNGKEVGRSPKTLNQMLGHYVVVAEMGKLYHPARQELNLDANGATVQLKLEPAYGSLRFSSEPPGAMVWIEGEKAGPTPYFNEQKPSGTYDVRVELENYLTWRDNVIVEDGKEAVRAVRLEQNYGSLRVSSEPPGATIEVNGRPTGAVTPHTFDVLEPDTYSVKMSLAGYGDAVEMATVLNRQTASVSVALQAKIGLVTIMSDYTDGASCDGEVYVDGEKKGVTPLKLQVPAREHEIRVVCPKGERRERVSVEHNKTLELQWTISAPTATANASVKASAGHDAQPYYEPGIAKKGAISLETWSRQVGFVPDLSGVPGFRAGVVVDQSNLGSFKPWIPDVLATLIGKYHLRLWTTEYRPVHPSVGYMEATERFAGQARINTSESNPRSPALSGYTAGLPFPGPKTGQEVAYNAHYAYAGDDSGYNYGVYWVSARNGVERSEEWRVRQVSRTVNRTDVEPLPAVPAFKNQDLSYTSMNWAVSPPDKRGFAALYRRLSDPKDMQGWIYFPTMRRVLRATFGTRGDAWNSTDLLYEDVRGYMGYPEWMNWTLKGKRTILAPMHSGLEAGKDARDKSFEFNEFPHWNPKMKWEPRAVYVVEATSRLADYPYSKMVLYYDADTYYIVLKECYDKKGQLWKVLLNAYNDSPDMNRFPLNVGTTLVVDLQSEHATLLPAYENQSNQGYDPDFFTETNLRKMGK